MHAEISANDERIPMVPAEHMAMVEEGIVSARANRTRELTEADWERLRQRARDAASANQRTRQVSRRTSGPPSCPKQHVPG